MRVLIDANVPLNVWANSARNPRPMVSESKRVMDAAASGGIEGYITPTIFSNVLYMLESMLDKRAAMAFGTELLDFTRMAGQDETIFRLALASGWRDLEDAAQYHAALAVPGMTAIVTTNLRDFRLAKRIKVYSPAQLARLL